VSSHERIARTQLNDPLLYTSELQQWLDVELAENLSMKVRRWK
jgi:hypothetical protein